jgi:glycine betaine/proline transport system substrate-binding protein
MGLTATSPHCAAADGIIARRLFLASSLAVGLAATATAPQTATPPVRLGVIGISFHAVAGAVVQAMLERLGHTVAVKQAPHDEMFRRLGAGEVDLLAAAWLPGTHRHLSDRLADRVAPIATLCRDARLDWTVPDCVPADVVASVAGLARTDVAVRMTPLNRLIGPSAGLSVRSVRMLAAYGLDAAGYRLEPGDTAVWLDSLRAARDAGLWVVMPLWQPHFLNSTHALRCLAAPQGVMGGADDSGQVARTTFAAALERRTRDALVAIHIGRDAVTDMDLAVIADGQTPAQAAGAWMTTNADRVAGWLAG